MYHEETFEPYYELLLKLLEKNRYGPYSGRDPYSGPKWPWEMEYWIVRGLEETN